MTLPSSNAAEQKSLAARLGYPENARVLVINGDDSGMCHAANVGTIEALEHGVMTTSTIMVPCPWFSEMADYARKNPARDLGIHLCHTSEWHFYKWGPVAPKEKVPGLVDPEGFLWPSIEEVYSKSTPEEALEEGRAQIRRALASGVDVTHLDSHMGTLQLNPKFIEPYLKLAVEFDLPVRMASQETMERFQQGGLRDKFAAQGILFTDYFVYEELKDEPKDVKGFWTRIVKNLKPGVTEFYVHAGKPNEELQAITGTWKTRGAEYELMANDAEFRKLLDDQGIVRIGYRPIRELQRKLRSSGTSK